MRKAISLILSLFFSSLLVFQVSAEGKKLNKGDLSVWNGSAVERIEKDSVIYVSDASGTAYYEEETNGAGAVWIYADAGNYSGDGAGTITADFVGESGDIISSLSVSVIDDGQFRRYSIGTDVLYMGIPENTVKIRLTLKPGGKHSAYFKSVFIDISETAGRDMNISEWKISGGIGPVQVNVTQADYWVMVVLVCLVALIFVAVRKILDKTSGRKIGTGR